MKSISSKPVPVPRLNSLLHRLQKNPGPEDEPYLDQLMRFLDDPPQDVADRWKVGAEMCAAWGVKTSGTSVWRLYRSYLIEWRVRVALNADGAELDPEAVAEKTEQLVELRMCEMLANPSTPPVILASLIRASMLGKYLQIAREKHAFSGTEKVERALHALHVRAGNDRVAQLRLVQLEDELPTHPTTNVEMFRIFRRALLAKEGKLDTAHSLHSRRAPSQPAPAPAKPPKVP